MRCLYCGKPLPFLKKFTGGGEFCSDAHKVKYQEEFNNLALTRLLQTAANQQAEEAQQEAEEYAPVSEAEPYTPAEEAAPQQQASPQTGRFPVNDTSTAFQYMPPAPAPEPDTLPYGRTQGFTAPPPPPEIPSGSGARAPGETPEAPFIWVRPDPLDLAAPSRSAAIGPLEWSKGNKKPPVKYPVNAAALDSKLSAPAVEPAPVAIPVAAATPAEPEARRSPAKPVETRPAEPRMIGRAQMVTEPARITMRKAGEPEWWVRDSKPVTFAPVGMKMELSLGSLSASPAQLRTRLVKLDPNPARPATAVVPAAPHAAPAPVAPPRQAGISAASQSTKPEIFIDLSMFGDDDDSEGDWARSGKAPPGLITSPISPSLAPVKPQEPSQAINPAAPWPAKALPAPVMTLKPLTPAARIANLSSASKDAQPHPNQPLADAFAQQPAATAPLTSQTAEQKPAALDSVAASIAPAPVREVPAGTETQQSADREVGKPGVAVKAGNAPVVEAARQAESPGIAEAKVDVGRSVVTSPEPIKLEPQAKPVPVAESPGAVPPKAEPAKPEPARVEQARLEAPAPARESREDRRNQRREDRRKKKNRRGEDDRRVENRRAEDREEQPVVQPTVERIVAPAAPIGPGVTPPDKPVPAPAPVATSPAVPQPVRETSRTAEAVKVQPNAERSTPAPVVDGKEGVKPAAKSLLEKPVEKSEPKAAEPAAKAPAKIELPKTEAPKPAAPKTEAVKPPETVKAEPPKAAAAKSEPSKPDVPKAATPKAEPAAAAAPAPAPVARDASSRRAPFEAPTLGSGPDLSNSINAQIPVAVKIGVLLLVLAGGGAAYYFGAKSEAGPAKVTSQKKEGKLVPISGSGGWATDWGGAEARAKERVISYLRATRTALDYRAEFDAVIQSKAVGWVFRAQDPYNYHAAKVEMLKDNTAATLTRFVMVGGIESQHHYTKILRPIRPGTKFKVTMDIRGNEFTVSINGEMVEVWQDTRIRTGGFGLLTEKSERAVVDQVKVSEWR